MSVCVCVVAVFFSFFFNGILPNITNDEKTVSFTFGGFKRVKTYSFILFNFKFNGAVESSGVCRKLRRCINVIRH